MLSRVVLTAVALAAGCASELRRQPMPTHVVHPAPSDFAAPDDVVVLHYYGAGGWLVKWRDVTVVTAPYFSNHSVERLFASRASPLVVIEPDDDRVAAGLGGTPIADTQLVLVGHGHIDHTGDLSALFGAGRIVGKPALVADRSTTNQLAALADRFSCIAPIDYGDPEATAQRCPVPHVRVTPIHHAHAPHLQLAGLEVAAFGGFEKKPLAEPPHRAEEFKLGNTWAFLIDLVDDEGAVVFRIHYADAAASPPHAIASAEIVKERDVDVAILCVPGFEQSDEYPEATLRAHNARYAIAAHWEDFFQPQSTALVPLRNVLDVSALERFIDVVERTLPAPRGVAPLNVCSPGSCGPHGATWSLPIPGEHSWFKVGPQPQAPALE